MEELYILKKPGSIRRRKRVGRGNASGHGSQAGKGHDGQLGRSGRKRRAWFEGGQMPLQRRVPKRGFSNYTRKDYQIIDVSSLDKLGSGEINPDLMEKGGLIASAEEPVKVLGNGNVTKAVKVTADAFSGSAADKIKKAGGDAIIRVFPGKKRGRDSTRKVSNA
jgi:large subunit ribosomal protein L15